MASEATDLADDALPGQPDHQRGAVAALGWRRKSSNQELVRFEVGVADGH